MLTPFGEIVEEIKKAHNIKYKVIADVLKTSPNYLSKVMHGKKNVPVGWVRTLNKVYRPSADKRAELDLAVAFSDSNYTIDTTRVNKNVLPIIIYLVKKSNKLSRNQITELREILHLNE